MDLITEDQIDAAAEQLAESEKILLQCLADLQERQPVVFAYLFSENLRALTQSERDYILYLLSVIWKTLQNLALFPPVVQEKQIAEAEEANWILIQSVRKKAFRDRLDVFFANSAQEDLLAFLEDALAEEEEDRTVSKEGREAVFITLKSIVDCWTS